MKKLVSIVLLVSLMVIPGAAMSQVMEENVEGVTVKASMMTHSMGKNTVTITLKDSNGNAITDAKVKIYYSMIPMKGMKPMSHKAIASFDGSGYQATVNLEMKGKWDLTIKAKLPDSRKLSAKMRVTIN